MEKQDLLDELEVEVNKLQKLLKDKQIGIFSWWSFLFDRLKNIKAISTKLGMVDEI